ncbi:spore gernimation protein GerD [Amphibacillus sp. MSJ-3]|uniref:spore germination lipoprotein GerD n=1 Tax=Amphibacillus sp. MSJ-3 TaxID=2841505 RepID=UPI001C0EAD3A|nr:spore germination lipoprotein GerD [Amphibacillus sp. MSJ-3]MBU5595076.1 spore gernimation protein GerD [Amphibacillus sp. MSJ-3]
MPKKYIIIILIILSLITGCSPGNDQSNHSQDGGYEATKKMVTDILKSEDGKKAIAEVIADDSSQEIYVIHDDTVKKAIEDALTSEKGKDFWSKMFSDQDFAKEFSLAMIEQQEDIFKRLMGDAEYQKKMLDLFANPEFEQQIQSQLKSQKFKGHLEESIQETLDSPLFQAKVSEIIVQHAKKIVGESEEDGKEEQDKQQSEKEDSKGESSQ